MKKKKNNHILLHESRVLNEGIVVLNGINQLPVYGDEFKVPHFVLVLIHSGSMKMKYEMGADEVSCEHTVALLYPNHSFVPLGVSSDYECSVVVMSAELYEANACNHVRLNRIQYENNPSLHLDDKQYDILDKAIKMLEGVCMLKSESRDELKMIVFNVIVKMLDVYRENSNNATYKPNRYVSTLFYDMLEKHCVTERSVEFYAQMLSLSPKHFSRTVAKETGHSVGYWIRKRVVEEAKRMIRNDYDLTLQEISDRLHFSDQASFSRYFKREAGMNPSEYRWKISH